MSTAAHHREWLDGRAAAARLCLPDIRAVKRLVASGRIRVRDMPTRAIYCSADVERLASEADSRTTTSPQE